MTDVSFGMFRYVSFFRASFSCLGWQDVADHIKLMNVQINGNRGDSPIYQGSNANIEMGGANSNQRIEYVRSYDPR